MKKLSMIALIIIAVFGMMSVIGAPKSFADLNDGLIAHYPIKGNANDCIGGNNGITYGVSLTTDRFGEPDSAYRFQGGSSEIIRAYLHNQSELHSLGAMEVSYSVSSWFKTNQQNAKMQIVGKNDGFSQYPFSIDVLYGYITFYMQADSGDGLSSEAPFRINTNYYVANNEWHHIVVVRDRVLIFTRISLYLDGLKIAEVDDLRQNADNLDDISIGNGGINYSQYPFTGMLDDIRIYKRALSEAEIQELYSYTPGIPDTDKDGIDDNNDNCPEISNSDQADLDGDGVGDLCDNCPYISNSDQIDTNNNGIGNACEVLCDECYNSLTNCQSGLTVCEKQLTICQNEPTGCGSDLSICLTRLSTYQTELSACQTDSSACQTELSACQAESYAYQTELSTCQTALSACQTDPSTCQAKLSACRIASSACQDNLTAANAEIARLRAKVAGLEDDLNDANATIRKQRDEIAGFTVTISSLRIQNKDLQDRLDTANATITDLEIQNAYLQSQLNTGTTNADMSKLRAEIARLKNDLNQGNQGLQEIGVLLRMPTGQRKSNSSYTGLMGELLNKIIEILTEPPGQAISGGPQNRKSGK
ncbi:MAG: LamG-like jellyroll fold domain-containing protein [bacterium]